MEYKRLGDIATYINGYAFKPSDRGEVGLPIIRIQDLTGNSYDLAYYNGAYPEKIEINNGDVLISWSASLGVYIWTNGKALLNQHIFKVVFDKIEVDKNYFVFAVQYYLKEMQRHAHGATMKHIIKKDFDNTRIPFPSLEQQENISKMLLKTKQLINAYQQEIDKLDNLVKARFVEMFGDCDLSHQNQDWKHISDIGTVVGGSTPKTSVDEYWNGEYRWISPAEIQQDSGIIFDSVKKITKAGIDSCSLQELPVGTVILSSRAPIGKLAIAGNTFYCNQGFKNIICKDNILPRYLYSLLLYNTEYLNSLGRGATFKEISKSIVENIKIPVPIMEKQKEFELFVQHIDKLKLLCHLIRLVPRHLLFNEKVEAEKAVTK